jgi:tRNA(Ile)-lysidine synthase
MPATRRSVAISDANDHRDVAHVEHAARTFVAESRRVEAPIVLAVSGGCDSMVMMQAVADAWRRSHPPAQPQLLVLTFDHGTGARATAAMDLVVREASRLGLQVRAGHARLAGVNEAEWRAARWQFLRDAAPPGSRIATAHTRDDQLETVVMRTMRGAGARGLAGLGGRSERVARPFLRVSRAAVRAYGNIRGVPFVEDPTNASRRYFRNRVRLELLPAIARVRPRFAEEMHELAERASEWRGEIDALAGRFVSGDVHDGVIRVARAELSTYDSSTLCVLWPAIAGRASVTLDRRGTLRLAQFTTSGAPGARMQLSGGIEVFRHRDSFIIRRSPLPQAVGGEVPLVGVVQFGEWRFRPVTGAGNRVKRSSGETPDEGPRVRREDLWVTDLPADRNLLVRAWRPADRMRARESGAARRVKRFFGDAQVPGPSRAGWPVVLADDEIIWIPGVRRTGAASERSGRPVVRYVCERFDGGLANS